MAKGLRASVKKNNRTKLRGNVFRHIEDARTARLSAKLVELAQQSKPTKSDMEVDSEKENDNEQSSQQAAEDMDVDDAAQSTTDSANRLAKPAKGRKDTGKITKRRHRKAKNQISFPRYDRNARKEKPSRKGK